MRSLIATVVLAFASAGPAFADDKTDVMSPIRQWVDAFNKGDVKAFAAACSDVTAIVDNLPPHEWHGAGACATWIAALDANMREGGVTDASVTLKKPMHVDVTGDRAYVVVPTAFGFKTKGKAVAQRGQLAVALQKVPAGWHMTGWAWADQ